MLRFGGRSAHFALLVRECDWSAKSSFQDLLIRQDCAIEVIRWIGTQISFIPTVMRDHCRCLAWSSHGIRDGGDHSPRRLKENPCAGLYNVPPPSLQTSNPDIKPLNVSTRKAYTTPNRYIEGSVISAPRFGLTSVSFRTDQPFSPDKSSKCTYNPSPSSSSQSVSTLAAPSRSRKPQRPK